MSTIFDEFVKIQTEKKNYVEKNAEQLKSEKSAWNHRIEELYEIIESHLQDYTRDGRITIIPSVMSLTEDLFGKYDTKALTITIGPNTVKLEPKGRFVIGAHGRVDMTGPAGTIKIVLVNENLSKPDISITILNGSEIIDQPMSKEVKKEPSLTWKLSTPPPHIAYYPLDKESFFEALMQVANG